MKHACPKCNEVYETKDLLNYVHKHLHEQIADGLRAALVEKDIEINALQRLLKEGTEDGSRCNRRCEGVMVGYCLKTPECSLCGFEVQETDQTEQSGKSGELTGCDFKAELASKDAQIESLRRGFDKLTKFKMENLRTQQGERIKELEAALKEINLRAEAVFFHKNYDPYLTYNIFKLSRAALEDK